MKVGKYDFSGYATKYDVLCTDGRTIKSGAFSHQDGKIVPLIWNHDHSTVSGVLGHALLKNDDYGVRFYGTFNDTEDGEIAKKLVQHGDLNSVSIWANHGEEDENKNVKKADIKELSLVLSGANPGALIQNVIRHGDEMEDEYMIYSGDIIDDIVNIKSSTISHKDSEEDPKEDPKDKSESTSTNDDKEETVEDVIDTMTDKQKTAMYAVIDAMFKEYGIDLEKDNEKKEDEEDSKMAHNAFENEENNNDDVIITHDDMKEIIRKAKKQKTSLKETFISHMEDLGVDPDSVLLRHTDDSPYGITNIDYLFPDARAIDSKPTFIQRDVEWVDKVLNSVHRTPFSRVKMLSADITEDEARAKGYITGKRKKEEVFTLLKRSTDPQTIYKKQKLDRDYIIDIEDDSYIDWLKSEMRMMLNEELARAILVGDGRSTSDDDKIQEAHIRSILNDDDLYSVKVKISVSNSDDNEAKTKKVIRNIIKSRKRYKGSGTPTLYVDEDVLTDMLLLEDANGRAIYDTEEKLRTALRVSEIISIPVMEGLKRKDPDDNKERKVYGILVNLNDYNIGASKGGEINFFDDFDIDFNQEKYLLETRCSGALIKPYSALVFEEDTTTNSSSTTP